jgi:hypothetical protein
MPQDGTGRINAPTQDPHPSWCQPDECTIDWNPPNGDGHGSFVYTVSPDDPVHTVIYLWARQEPGGVEPLLVKVEISDYRTGGETTETFPLTHAQLRRLHEVTGELLTSLATG